jgi:hypothetical protein
VKLGKLTISVVLLLLLLLLVCCAGSCPEWS